MYRIGDQCISTGRSLWRSQDGNKARGQATPFFPVADHAQAEKWNEEKWGIYWTVNEVGADRKEASLVKILSWAIDFDEMSKLEQRERIRKFGLIPSLVIESARGYHVYFDAIDATKENYNKILTALCEKLGADQGAKGVNRILRCPFYYHWKDEKNPFAVRIEDENSVAYTEKEMLRFLAREEKKPSRFELKAKEFRKTKSSGQDDFFTRVDQINCEIGLQRLSGTEAVNFESYRFKQVNGGKIAVFVNDKSANVWIDAKGRIGSCDKGGPSIYSWLKWFGHSHLRIKEILETTFPEVFR
jgi:hypothetical protein